MGTGRPLTTQSTEARWRQPPAASLFPCPLLPACSLAPTYTGAQAARSAAPTGTRSLITLTPVLHHPQDRAGAGPRPKVPFLPADTQSSGIRLPGVLSNSAFQPLAPPLPCPSLLILVGETRHTQMNEWSQPCPRSAYVHGGAAIPQGRAVLRKLRGGGRRAPKGVSP